MTHSAVILSKITNHTPCVLLSKHCLFVQDEIKNIPRRLHIHYLQNKTKLNYYLFYSSSWSRDFDFYAFVHSASFSNGVSQYLDPFTQGLGRFFVEALPLQKWCFSLVGILLNPDHIDVRESRTRRWSVSSSCWIPFSWSIVFQGVTSIVEKGCISASRLAAPVPPSLGRLERKRNRIRPTKSWGLHYHTFLRGSKAPPLLVLLLSCLLILPVTYWW